MGKNHSSLESDGCCEQIIPDDILAEIFLRLPGQDVVKSCMHVCKDWYRVATSQSLWKDKCARDLLYSEDMLRLLMGEDFKLLYFKNPYGRNLLQNPDASDGMKHWTVTHNGGDGWQIEAEPIGADPVENFAKVADNRPGGKVGCWSTSFYTCKKHQLINLVECGCSPAVLDELRPDITVSEWFSARFDCGIKFRMRVDLLKETTTKKGQTADYDSPLDTFEEEYEKPAGREWFQVRHTFTGYPPGLRYIEYVHGGKDTQFWAGNFGAKMTLATVKFDLSHCSGALHHPS